MTFKQEIQLPILEKKKQIIIEKNQYKWHLWLV